MILTFSTKKTTTGNTYGLEIDTVRRIYWEQIITRASDIKVTRQQLQDIKETCDQEGYRCGD